MTSSEQALRQEAEQLYERRLEELAHELHDLGAEIQEYAEGMRSLIEDYDDLRGRLIAANRRAGQDVGGRWGRTVSILAPWLRGLLGGQNSLVGIPGEQVGQVRTPNRERRSLSERDPLAASRTDSDD
jgi:hypothetical protein